MHIYGSQVSPFVQRVLLAARAKGHEIDVRLPSGEGGMRSPEFRAISPMGRIPLLELDDGTRICESLAIAAYLDEMLDGPALLPGDPLGRARVREIEAVAALEYGAGTRPVMVRKVFGRPVADGVVDAALVQLTNGADVLDGMLAGSTTYAVGDALTLADCILVPILTLTLMIDGAAGTAGLVRDRANLSAYIDRMAADPVAGRTVAEMNQGFAAMLARNVQPAS